MAKKYKDSFWLSYSDLMTSLFFIMLVLFIVCFCVYKAKTSDLMKEGQDAANEIGVLKDSLQLKDSLLDEFRRKNDSANATIRELQQINNLQEQFEQLSKNTALQYVPEKKMFVAKDFIGIEIFNPEQNNIKWQYIQKVDDVGRSLQNLVKQLYDNNPKLSFQLVIEGYAAIPWQDLQNHRYNPDNVWIYELSYRRALALYLRWRQIGINLRKYNTEIIIAGSGFNGINRDNWKEENNKRFVIQVIPKIAKPK